MAFITILETVVIMPLDAYIVTLFYKLVSKKTGYILHARCQQIRFTFASESRVAMHFKQIMANIYAQETKNLYFIQEQAWLVPAYLLVTTKAASV